MEKSSADKDSLGIEFDDVFQQVNSFGRYQKVLYLGINCLVIPIMLQFGLLLFAMGIPQFHCDVTNTTCPPNTCCDNCTAYIFDGPFTSTVSEWHLICDRASLGATIQSCFFGGALVSSLLSGILSDTFGRKTCIFACSIIMASFSLGSPFARSAPLFGFLQFCVGFGVTGVALSLYVLTIEIVGPSWRTLAGNLSNLYWEGSGFMSILLAYWIRDWRILIVVSTVPTFLLFPFFKVIPESPRFLVTKGLLDEAHKVLMRYGGKDDDPLDPMVLRSMIEDIRREQITKEKNRKRYTPLDVFRTPKIRKWIIVLCYNWFVVALIDFAIYLSVARLAGDMYLNASLMHITPLIMEGIVWLLLKRIGRRICNAGLMLLGGTSCLLILIVPDAQPMIKSALAIAGQGFTVCAYTTLYLIASELFPTVVRGTSIGTCATGGRIGAILAPYMVMMGYLPGVDMSLPMTIFGVLALVAGIVTYWIPETLFANMHQTIEEAEAAKDDYGMPCCRRKPRAFEDEMESRNKKTENVSLAAFTEAGHDNKGLSSDIPLSFTQNTTAHSPRGGESNVSTEEYSLDTSL